MVSFAGPPASFSGSFCGHGSPVLPEAAATAPSIAKAKLKKAALFALIPSPKIGPHNRANAGQIPLQACTLVGERQAHPRVRRGRIVLYPQEAGMADIRHAHPGAIWPESIKEHWSLYLIEGIVLILLGVAAVLVPVLA